MQKQRKTAPPETVTDHRLMFRRAYDHKDILVRDLGVSFSGGLGFLSLLSELYGYVTPLHMLMIGLEASTK